MTLSLVPQGIQDESTLAMEQLINRMGEIDLSPVLVYLIDNVDVTALCFLAEQFHVLGNEGWQLAVTEAQQRALIKDSISLHKLKGTVAGVKRVLEALDIQGVIEEWFEYDGKPFHFRITTKLQDRDYDLAMFTDLIKMIDEYKNVRSKLESINVEMEFQTQPHTASFLKLENTIKWEAIS